MRKFVAKHFLFPVYDIINNTQVVKLLKLYRKTQWYNNKEIVRLQFNRLKKLIIYSYENVDYYKKLMDKHNISPYKIKNLYDLQKFPILTKEDVKKNINELTTREHIKKIPNKTSGSTGTPMKFYYGDYGYSNQLALMLRNYEWANLSIGDKYFLLWSSTEDLNAQQRIYHKIKNYFLGRVYFPAENMSKEKIELLINNLKRHNIKTLEGYVSAIYALCKYLEANNKKISIPKLIPAAGVVYPSHKLIFKKYLGSEIFERYGSREFLSIAHECGSHEGLHINEENYILEILDKNNKHISEGIGKIIITDLSNYTMPFIRYEIGDLSSISKHKCSCGRNLRLLNNITGRTQDVIVTKDGDYIAGEYLIGFFIGVFFVEKYQFVQKKIDLLHIYLLLKEGYGKKDLVDINKNIIKFFDGKMKVKIFIVKDMPNQKNGKFRFIRSELKKHV